MIHLPDGKPSDDELFEIEAIATALADAAGVLLLERFQAKIEIEFKDRLESDPVTEADRDAEKLIRRGIMERFPTHGILGEEGVDSGSLDADFIWVIDPLDGTVNFINNFPFFACSIGVLWRGFPVVGAVFMATTRYLCSGVYHSRHGGGLVFNNNRISYDLADLASGARLNAFPGDVGSASRFSGIGPGNKRTLGSIAAELVLTAEGTLQRCLFSNPKIWDVAGGVAICLESGISVDVKNRNKREWMSFQRFVGADERAPTCSKIRTWNQQLTAGYSDLALLRNRRENRGPLGILRGFF